MAIVIHKQPSARNWSGNPIHYRLYSAAAEAEATAYFEIKIMFKRLDDITYREIVTMPYSPINGTADFDIQFILDGLLEYELPLLPTGLEASSPLFCKTMTGHFYIAYREITIADPTPDFTDVVPEEPPFVIKGGISFEKWRGDNYWVNYFYVALPFLTWQRSGRLASLTERMYLAWLNTSDTATASIKMRRKVVYTDGTIVTEDINCPSFKNEVVYFPTGAKQLDILSIFPTKKIEYWEMQIVDTATTLPLSELYRYTVDNKFDANDRTFNYRNSLGGLDSARVRGIIEKTGERKFTPQDSIVQHDYFIGHFIAPKVINADSTELLLHKADIGFVGKEEQDWLRELHFKRECWEEQAKKWIPISINTGSATITSSKDNLWSMPIEFSLAHTGDRFYTPSNANLAEGGFTSPVMCTANISELTVETNEAGDQWTVSWELLGGAPIRYNVSTPGVSGGAPDFITELSKLFTWLPFGDNLITVQPVCFIGGKYYLGTPRTVTITRGEVCTPVGFDEFPELPDAEKDQPYYYEFGLTGSSPFELADVIKPAWMTIEIIDNIVRFTGTPLATTAGTVISFKIKNCSGNNSITFSDNIAVVTYVSPTYYFYEAQVRDCTDDCTVSTGTIIVAANDPALVLNRYYLKKGLLDAPTETYYVTGPAAPAAALIIDAAPNFATCIIACTYIP